MNRIMRRRQPDESRGQGGFTLVELMISLLLFSFATAGVLSVAVATTRAFREQRRVLKIENAARAPMDYVIDALRQASPGVSQGTIGNAAACATAPALPASGMLGNGAVAFSDNTGTDGSDVLDIVFASGAVVGTLHTDLALGATSVNVNDQSVPNFATGDYFLITNSAVATLFQVTTPLTTTTLPIAACTNALAWPIASYPAHSLLVRAQYARFTINPLDGIPTLWMDPDGPSGSAAAEPVAEGVEDMQIAIAVDDDNNNIIDEVGAAANDDEWVGNVSGDTWPVGTFPIRAVKVVLVARDTNPILGPLNYARPAVLNHTAGSADAYRRRVLSSIVEIRNLTGSP